MDDGFKYIKSKGDVLEESYPYTGKTGTCTKSKTKNPAVKLSGYKDVKANSEAQLMAAVEKQPVSVAIEADQSGFQFYKSGVFSGTCGTQLDHGVLAVGYGSESGKDYWKVKNSWGTSWGQNGYIMMARNIGNKAGQCGIASQPSYPTMSKTSLAAPQTTQLTLTYEDCGVGAHVKVTGVTPTSLPLGKKTEISGAGTLDADVSGATYEMTMTGVGGISLLNCKGDGSKDATCKIGLGPISVGTLDYHGITFPVKSGKITGIPKVDLTLPAGLPSFALKTTTTLTVTDSDDGKMLFCVKLSTTPA